MLTDKPFGSVAMFASGRITTGKCAPVLMKDGLVLPARKLADNDFVDVLDMANLNRKVPVFNT